MTASTETPLRERAQKWVDKWRRISAVTADAERHLIDYVESAITEAVAAEREACAKVAETTEEPTMQEGEYWIAARIAAAIRSRRP